MNRLQKTCLILFGAIVMVFGYGWNRAAIHSLAQHSAIHSKGLQAAGCTMAITSADGAKSLKQLADEQCDSFVAPDQLISRLEVFVGSLNGDIKIDTGRGTQFGIQRGDDKQFTITEAENIDMSEVPFSTDSNLPVTFYVYLQFYPR